MEESEKQIEVLTSIKENNPELLPSCYLVGAWVWAEFHEKPSQESISFLKEIGFRWNRTRKVWQNACGRFTRQSAGDPRKKYSVLKFED